MSRPNILIILADDLGVDAFRIDKANKQVIAAIEGEDDHAKGIVGDKAGPRRLPTFERLLENGIHFEFAWAHPVCTPTRGSLWTGLQPWKTGLGYPANPGEIERDVPTTSLAGSPVQSLAQAVKSQNREYRCAMFGKWDLGPGRNPVQLGWDYFAGIFGGGLRQVGSSEYGLAGIKFDPDKKPNNRVSYERLLNPTNLVAALNDPKKAQEKENKIKQCKTIASYLAGKYDEAFLRNNPDLRYYIWHKDVVASDGTVTERQPPEKRKEPYATADQVADAKEWIASHSDKPWCVALNLITPHDPFHLPPPGTYSKDGISDPKNPSAQDMLVAMMESMDYYVGDLLKAIDSQLGNTVVFFVGDNGTQDVDPDTGQGLDKSKGDDKSSIGIGGVLVPMIVADGGRMKGGAPCYVKVAPRSVADPVHIIDIYRTVYDIAGLVPTTPAIPNDSISLAPHLTGIGGGLTKRRFSFSQMYIPPVSKEIEKGKIVYTSPTIGASASDGAYKLSCRCLLDGNTLDTWLVDEKKNLVDKPVYTYEFSRLDPETGIPGSLVSTPIKALEPRGSCFAITDETYRTKIMELYATLCRERLDYNLSSYFPYISDSPLSWVDQLTLTRGKFLWVPSIDLHAIDFTVTAKVKLASTANRNIIFANWGAAGKSWQMLFAVMAGGRPLVWLRKDMDSDIDLVCLEGSKSLVAGTFQQLAFTFTWGLDRKSPCCVIYVDGTEAGRLAPKITPDPRVRNLYQLMPTSNSYWIGRKEDTDDADSWFTGEIRNFTVYGQALDAAAIAALR